MFYYKINNDVFPILNNFQIIKRTDYMLENHS